jgi:cell division protein FtsZ
MIEVVSEESGTKILVIGVGGAGNNAVNRMIDTNIQGIDMKCVNTDSQQLKKCKTQSNIQIGEKLTHGQGAGAHPQVGEKAAEESKDELVNAIKGYDMVFVTCGMGGGTGTGAAPVIAKIAREAGALTVGVVSTPFSFEGKTRSINAQSGIEKLRSCVDTLLVVPNDNILKIVNKKTSIKESFRMADEILVQSVTGVTDIITNVGVINVDFADVVTIMKDKGLAHIGIGTATGENKCIEALERAISSPLLDTKIDGATDILINYSGSSLVTTEIYEATDRLREMVSSDANIIFGAIELEEDSDDDSIQVTVIATGLPEEDNIKEEEQVTTRSNDYRNDSYIRATQQSTQQTQTSMNGYQPLNRQPRAAAPQILGTGKQAVNPTKYAQPFGRGGMEDSADANEIKIPEFLQIQKKTNR